MPFQQGNTLYKLRKTNGQRPTGIYHSNWKGDNACYKSKHEWARRCLTRPKTCCKCSNPPKEVANIDKKYSRNLTTWQWMCVPCHRIMDFARLRNERGYAKARVAKL